MGTKQMFVVLDGGKPANCFNHKVHSSWDAKGFATFEDANTYAHKWLGAYGTGVNLELNKPYDYSGYGDCIEIREVKLSPMFRVSHQPFLHHPYLIYNDTAGIVMCHCNDEERAKDVCKALNYYQDQEG